jgi:hypothetical protein
LRLPWALLWDTWCLEIVRVRRRMELVIEEVVVMTYVLYIWASTSWECGLRRGMQGVLLRSELLE